MKLNYLLLFFYLLFMSCDKDLSVPVGKGNYIAVSSSEISSITTNSAKCSFIVNDLNNETVVEQGLCWEITSKPTTANKKIAVTLGTGTFSTNLTNLNPNQTYYVRSYVKLNTGVTMYGDEKYFITKDILPATFRESTISNITATSAQVTGSILDNGGSNLSDVGVVYGYSTNPTIQDIRISAGASATSFTISLSGLILNTTYNLRPYAINSKGVSYGTNVLFQTKSYSIPESNIGLDFQGGVIAYILKPSDPGYDAKVDHGIIVSKIDQTFNVKAPYNPDDTGCMWQIGRYINQTTIFDLTNATGSAIGQGKLNTDKIKAVQTLTGRPFAAANYALTFNGGGFTDWVLPSREELKIIYINKSKLGTFANGWYWTSTEKNDAYAEAIHFGTGSLIDQYKGPSGDAVKVRAIRYF
jgi:hypothetical protein